MNVSRQELLVMFIQQAKKRTGRPVTEDDPISYDAVNAVASGLKFQVGWTIREVLDANFPDCR